MDYTDEFETFWRKFPSRWNKDFQGGTYVKRKKRPAFEKWRKLPQAIRNECLAKVHLVRQSEGGSVRNCVTWLNQCGWEDIETETPKSLGLPDPFKSVPSVEVNVNNRRNEQLDKLEV